MNILITGFKPFGGQEKNVTELLLDDFHYEHQEVQMFKIIFPTVFNIINHLHEAINMANPDIIIHLGEHAKAQAITLEKVAINIDDARIPDNEGKQPIDQQIHIKGEPAYFSRLPIRAIENALKVADIPVAISYSAGTYVCNHLFYLSEFLQGEQKNRILSGFIHLPLVKTQYVSSLFDLDTLKRALTIILDTCIHY